MADKFEIGDLIRVVVKDADSDHGKPGFPGGISRHALEELSHHVFTITNVSWRSGTTIYHVHDSVTATSKKMNGIEWRFMEHWIDFAVPPAAYPSEDIDARLARLRDENLASVFS